LETLIIIILNLILVASFIYIARKKNFLSFFSGGKWLLTWFAVGIITLMDELTSIYYAPFEAYRFIGLKAIFYIALTSLLIRFLSTRMVEISEILEENGMKGGGVYSFSYLAFGPSLSFVAISSILVDYVLTATISTVSAVNNGTAFLGTGPLFDYLMMFGVIGFITALNIIGIKENARFTFLIFIMASFVLINLIVGGLFNFSPAVVNNLHEGFNEFTTDFTKGNVLDSYTLMITGIGACILAYSGVESVLQTASLVQNWKVIKKAYIFLAVTVGLVTPIIALLAISASNININHHETDLIPFFASSVNGKTFGFFVSILATITLIMAVNTAMVASAELIEKVAERYNFQWLITVNKRQSLYRIHLINALFYSGILIITRGSQAVLAEMYAVGLVASFVINTGALLKYRYQKGKKTISKYYTSRTGTLILFIILVSTFIYIVTHRPYGTLLWFIITSLFIYLGYRISKTRSPEKASRIVTNNPMDIIFALSEIESKDVNIVFQRPKESDAKYGDPNTVYVTFYTPRLEKPETKIPNQFWIAIQPRASLYNMIYGILMAIKSDIGTEKNITVYFGWPMSSWFDRLSISTMIYNITRLPKRFPEFSFIMNYISNLPNEKVMK
jgi:amino acid transporter